MPPDPPNDIPRATQRKAARHGPSPEARGRTQDPHDRRARGACLHALEILTSDRPGSVAYRACTSTSGCMCTESSCPCARARAPYVAARVAVHQSHAGRPNGEPERARPGLGRRCRTALRPGGRATGPPAPRSGARHPSGTDCWLGVTPQRRGGWGCPAPSPLAPIEVCPRWGSLPATSKERRLASAFRWPWCNRKRTSDMDGRGRVRPNGDFVSGDPQSEPDTQDLPPTPASGGQNGSPDRRLERHHGEDVGGRDVIGVRLRLGDNPCGGLGRRYAGGVDGRCGAHASRCAVTEGRGGAPIRDLHGSATSGGSKGGQGHPSPAPGLYPG